MLLKCYFYYSCKVQCVTSQFCLFLEYIQWRVDLSRRSVSRKWSPRGSRMRRCCAAAGRAASAPLTLRAVRLVQWRGLSKGLHKWWTVSRTRPYYSAIRRTSSTPYVCCEVCEVVTQQHGDLERNVSRKWCPRATRMRWCHAAAGRAASPPLPLCAVRLVPTVAGDSAKKRFTCNGQ